eukprot:5216624-Pyramimonas_sp.AAC.1
MEHPTTASRPRRSGREGLLALGQESCAFLSRPPRHRGDGPRPARRVPCLALRAAAAAAARCT